MPNGRNSSGHITAFVRVRPDTSGFKREAERGIGAQGKRVGAIFAKGFAVTAGIGAIVAAESVKMATAFQSSMTKIRTQAGGTQRDVTSLTKAVLKMGPSAQQGPQELADALYHLKSIGLGNVQAMKALRTASDLAAVGGAHLEETTSAIGAAWRSGIKGAQNFGKAAGTVNGIIGAGNMRMSDFIDALSSGILPAAKTFGVSLKSVGSALALMTDEGIPAQDAATRLRMTLSLMGAPSKVAIGALKTIGLSSTALANAMRGPGGLVAAVGLLKQHLHDSGLSATQAAAVISHAFGGGRSSSAIETMLNNLETLRKKQAQINDTTGRYGAAVIAQRKTAAAQFALLRSAVETIGIRIGAALLPPVTQFAHFLAVTVVPGAVTAGKIIGRAFSSVIPVKTIERDWKKVLAFFGAAPKPKPYNPYPYGGMPKGWKPPVPFFNYGSLTPDPKKLTSSLAGRLTDALKSVKWGEIIGKVISGAVAQAPKIGAAFSDLIGKVDWAEAGKKAAPALVPFAIGLVNSLVSALISEAIHHPLDMLTFITSLIPIGRAAGIIVKVFGKIPFLGPLLKLFLGPMEKAGSFIEKGLGKLLKLVFGPVLKRIEPFFSGAVGWLRGKGEAILLGLWYGAQRIWGKITGWLGRIFGWVLKPFGRAASWLLSKGGDIISGLWSGIKNIWPKVTGWLGSVGGWVKGKFATAATWLLKAGGSIVHGLLTGIRNYMAGIGSWIKGNIVDPIINAVKHFFGISSPSTVMASIGGHLVSGLIRGMIRANPVAMVTRVFGSMPKALGALVGKGLVDLAKLPGKALRALGGLGGWLGHLFGFGGGGGSGVQRWSGLVLKVLGMLHQSPSWLPVVLRRMNQESGGNPNAINLTDINAQMGDPSRGLMQTIGATFNAYAGPFRGLGIYNPLANIYAGLNYALHRYGSLAALARPGGYARGGLITEPIFGVGRSGRSYTFGEKGTERVTPGAGPAGDAEQMERLIAVVQQSPFMIANLIADALNSVGRRSAHAAAWSGGSW